MWIFIVTNQCCVNHVDKLSIKPKNIVVFNKALLVYYLFRKHILETWFLFVWCYLLRSPNREYCDLLPVTINDNWRNWLKNPKGFLSLAHFSTGHWCIVHNRWVAWSWCNLPTGVWSKRLISQRENSSPRTYSSVVRPSGFC